MEFLANFEGRSCRFSSIFPYSSFSGDLKMAASYLSLEDVLEIVVNDDEVSNLDDEIDEDIPDLSSEKDDSNLSLNQVNLRLNSGKIVTTLVSL